MKKFAVVLLALVMSLTLIASAFASEAMFAMTTVTDMEGNVLATVTEDGTVVDAAGNDISDEFPVLVFQLDDETMTCVFGTEDEVISGTAEITEQSEQGVALWVSLEDGEEFQIVYTVEGVNACSYVDEENGMVFIMPQIG